MNVKDINYQTLNIELRNLIQDETDALANLSNSAALLFHSMDNINWAGFYLFKDNQLILCPFQGKPACIRIAIGKGVCGTAAQRREAVIVKDVHQFEGHIACDNASASEIVIPIIKYGKLIGVLDIGSPVIERFTESDRQGLQAYADTLNDCIDWGNLPV